MLVVPMANERETILNMPDPLMYERKNELWWVLFFLFFCHMKTIPDQNGVVKRKACCILLHVLIDII